MNIEHSFIDFQWLILGDKLKNINNNEIKSLKYDSLYFAELMMK